MTEQTVNEPSIGEGMAENGGKLNDKPHYETTRQGVLKPTLQQEIRVQTPGPEDYPIFGRLFHVPRDLQ